MSTAEIRSLIATEIAGLTPELVDPFPPYGYGNDVAGWTDMDPNDNPTSDPQLALAQAALRHVITPRGSLPGESAEEKDWGTDLRAGLNKAMFKGDLMEMEQGAATELRKDDRINDASVTYTTNGRDSAHIAIRLTPADSGQSFTLTGTITSIGVEALVVQ